MPDLIGDPQAYDPSYISHVSLKTTHIAEMKSHRRLSHVSPRAGDLVSWRSGCGGDILEFAAPIW